MKKNEGLSVRFHILSSFLICILIMISGCSSSSSEGIIAGQQAMEMGEASLEQEEEQSEAVTDNTETVISEDSSASATAVSGDSTDNLGLPVLTETECVWDENGNLISETAHDTDGNPSLNARGFYQAKYTYDSLGNRLTEEYYDTKNKLIDTNTGYARAEYTYRTDENNKSYILTEDRYAANGARADIPGSYSYRRDVWEREQIISSSYYDAKDNLTRPTGGYAQILYDVKRGNTTNIVTKRYLDADGSPLTGTEGGSVIVSEYTNKEYSINIKTAAAEDITRDDWITGVSEANIAGTHYRNTEETGGNGTEGISGTQESLAQTNAYTAHLLLSRRIYGPDDTKVLGYNRWHIVQNTYDDGGRRTRTDYLDPNGSPILSSSGFASVVYTYDNSDRVIEIDFYDVEDNLIKNVGGYAKVTYEYHGNSGRVHFERY